jgi:hypothetical protein
MKKTILLLTVVSIFFAFLAVSGEASWEESPSGWGNGGSSPSSVGGGGFSISFDYNQAMRDFDAFMQNAKIQFESYGIPMWIKELEVKNHGKNSPFYDEVMSKN